MTISCSPITIPTLNKEDLMKKIIAVLICAAVCLTTGCSKSETSSGTQLPATTSSSNKSSVTQPAVTPSSKTSSTSSQTSEPTSVPTSEPTTARGEFQRGKWSGNSFTSYFFGYKLNLDGWTKETDEQLAKRNSIADMSDTTLNSAVEQSNENTAVYEVFAQDANANTLAVAVNRYNGKTIDEYTQANANGIKMSSSFKDVSVDKVNVAGKDQPCIYATFASGSVDVYEAMVVYQNGNYFSIITIGAFSKSDLQNIIGSVFTGASTPSGSTSEPSANNGAYQRGKWNGNTFASNFFGYSFTLDSSWTIESDQQVAARNSLSDMSDATVNNAVEQSNENSMVYEAVAQDANANTLAIGANRYNGKTIDEYAQANANGMKFSTSFKDVSVDKINIAGKDQPCIYATYTSGGIDVYEIIVIYQNGDYFTAITLGSLSQNDLKNTLDTIFA